MRFTILGKNGHQTVELNRRRAIRERCKNCCGWSNAAVENCNMTDCALHLYRNGRGRQDPKKRDRAIRAYCRWCMDGRINEVRKCTADDCPLYPYRIKTTARKKEHIGGIPEAVSAAG